MTNLSFLRLMAPTGTQGQPNSMMTFLPLIAVFVIFYFFMIRPGIKKQKEAAKFRNNLKEGDKVITNGGVYGKVVKVEDTYVMLEIDNNVKIKIDKSAVGFLQANAENSNR